MNRNQDSWIFTNYDAISSLAVFILNVSGVLSSATLVQRTFDDYGRLTTHMGGSPTSSTRPTTRSSFTATTRPPRRGRVAIVQIVCSAPASKRSNVGR
jgi:hypothetical protein